MTTGDWTWAIWHWWGVYSSSECKDTHTLYSCTPHPTLGRPWTVSQRAKAFISTVGGTSIFICQTQPLAACDSHMQSNHWPHCFLFPALSMCLSSTTYNIMNRHWKGLKMFGLKNNEKQFVFWYSNLRKCPLVRLNWGLGLTGSGKEHLPQMRMQMTFKKGL